MWNALKSKLGPVVNLPGGYWLISRQTPRTIAGWLVKVWGYAALFAVLIANYSPLAALGITILAWFTFLCVYECGYYQNDTWLDHERAGRHYRRGPEFVRLPLFLLTRVALLGLTFWLLHWWSNGVWIGLLAITAVVFALHNRLGSEHRVGTFISLRVLSSLSMAAPVIGQLPDHQTRATLIYLLPVLVSDLLPRMMHYGLEKKGLRSPHWVTAALMLQLVGPPIVIAAAWPAGEKTLAMLAAYQWCAWLTIRALPGRAKDKPAEPTYAEGYTPPTPATSA